MKETTSSNMAIRLLTLLLLALFVFPNLSAKKTKLADSPSDMADAEKAMEWFDAGEYQAALDVLDALRKKYPDEPSLQYETGLCLFVMEKYSEAKDIYEKLAKRKDATPLDFSMLGNCYDMMGDPQKAVETYAEGSDKFPGNAIFFTETGNVFNRYGDYEHALKYYQMGMNADPNQPNDYFRAATILFNSQEPIWGLIYAETEIMLDIEQPSRQAVMSDGMASCYKENFSVDGDSVKVSLIDKRGITVNQENNNVTLECGGVLEGCYGKALTRMVNEKLPIDLSSLSTLTTLRKYMVEEYFKVTNNLFGNGMYLLEYQKAVIDAGHWDAYNWYIFNESLEFECETWRLTHEDEIYKFAEWYEENEFKLGDGKSVCRTQVQEYARPLNLIEAIMIQGGLISDSDKEGVEE